ncbi:MAG: TRAP transporter large permease [Lentisphaeria bacterium]|nr:TRAP transporter large permease [Lentisphaeria bacterium]
MSPEQAGIMGVCALFLLLAASVPVALAMTVVGMLGFALVTGDAAAAAHMASRDFFAVFTNYNLTVIPLFVFMGQVSFHSGISKRLFTCANCWLAGITGGLAMATVGACAAFGAICGSGPATAATMATVTLPEMKRYGYSLELGTGTVAAAGGLGMLIPPSVVFIVYGIMAEESIGRLFLAGVVPGLLITGLFCLTVYLNCKRNPGLAPPTRPHSVHEKVTSLVGTLEAVVLFAVVIGGMFLGFFTPTEAAAVGAAGAVLVAVVRRKLGWKAFRQSLRETARTSCMVMTIVAGAMVFGHFLAVTRIPYTLAGWVGDLDLPRGVILGGVILFFLVGGCFVDALALILLTVPVLLPVIHKLGYDPIWFGVIVVLVTQMGVISPPVGVNVYVVSGLERDVSLETVFKGAFPFLIALVVGTVLITLFPRLCLFLPELMKG